MTTKTALEVLQPYVEKVFRHTEVVERDNALMAMEDYARQWKKSPGIQFTEPHPEKYNKVWIAELVGVPGLVVEGNTKKAAFEELVEYMRIHYGLID